MAIGVALAGVVFGCGAAELDGGAESSSADPLFREAMAAWATRSDTADLGVSFRELDAEARQSLSDLAEALAGTGLVSRVRVKTQEPGAVVKYQLVARSDVSSCQRVTNDVEEDWTIGIYYVWAERSDEVTSSRRKFVVVAEETHLDLVED